MNTRTLVAALAGLSLVAAACGSDSDSAESTSIDPATTESVMTEPVETEPAATDPTGTEPATSGDVPATPERVVSLSPTHTEMMFAIGAGDLLVAVDDFSNFPAEALELPNELSGFEPNVEAIAAFEPDLVLIGGDFTGLGRPTRRTRHRVVGRPRCDDDLRHLHPDRAARGSDRQRGRSRRTGVIDADPNRRTRRRGAATAVPG